MSAIISECGTYRYQLSRQFEQLQWQEPNPAVFLMLNPSTADASLDDPTIRRCRGFAASLGYTGFVVVNLYALRSTDPKGLWVHPDPVGAKNDQHLRDIASKYDHVICAWGANAKSDRVKQVEQIFKSAGCKMMCLGLTKSGAPRHPLYIKADAQLIEIERLEGEQGE